MKFFHINNRKFLVPYRIALGLKDCIKLDNNFLLSYLLSRQGFHKEISQEELKILILQ